MSYYESTAEQKGYFRFEKRGDYITPAHFHGAIELLFVKEGEQEVSIGGEHRVLRAGDACFVESFTPHSYTKPKGELYVLLGERKYFEESFATLEKKHPPRFFRFENFALLEWLSNLCRQAYKNPVNRLTAFECSIKILLAEISETTVFEETKKDKKSYLVCQILQYANDNLQEDLSLHTLAKRFGYSHEYLSRLLHKSLLENWSGYVNRLRVRRAERLLQKNDTDSIVQIAYDCGFDSVHTFYRAYKKEFGNTPHRN